jgi:hypothetical protein
MRDWEVGKSECCPVMGQIGVLTSPYAKASPRPTGLSLRENLENCNDEEKQMSVALVGTFATGFCNLPD